MKRMNNKGFTLVELIAIIVLLALVMSIGAISVTTVIKKAKEKDYELLVENIKGAVEMYYQERTYSKTDVVACPSADASGWINIELGDLVEYGFIKGNAAASDGSLILTNTDDGRDLASCKIKYRYNAGKIEIKHVSGGSSCPPSDKYSS